MAAKKKKATTPVRATRATPAVPAKEGIDETVAGGKYLNEAGELTNADGKLIDDDGNLLDEE